MRGGEASPPSAGGTRRGAASPSDMVVHAAGQGQAGGAQATSCLAAVSARNLGLVFVSLIIFITLHSSIALYNLRNLSVPTPRCLIRELSDASTVTTQAVTEPVQPRKNLVSTTGNKNIDLWINSAILDTRANRTRVHIFGVERRNAVKSEFFCRWKYSTDDSIDGAYVEIRSEHNLVDSHWPHWGPVFASHFTCRIPLGVSLDSISLVSRDGGARYENIPIDSGEKRNPRRPLAVCVKPATSALSVLRLVEWFETIRAAGISHVIMYHTDVMGNGRYVLEYYQKLGVLTLVSYPFLFAILERVDTDTANLSGQDRYAVYQQVYLAALQDCLHRFRPSYEHLLFMDIDEVLLPMKTESLVVTVKRLKARTNNVAGFLFLTSWHFEDFGAKKNDNAVEKLYIHKYIEGTEPIDNQPKCVVVTDLAEAVNFHGVTSTFRDKYEVNQVVPWQEYGYLLHFRGKCDEKFEKKRCVEELLPKHRPDPVLLRYRDKVVSGIKKVIEIIQLH